MRSVFDLEPQKEIKWAKSELKDQIPCNLRCLQNIEISGEEIKYRS